MEKQQVMLPTASTSSTALSSQNQSDKEAKHHRYAFQTRSPVDVLDDGYQWRKYGKKIVKNNTFPSYYRCAHRECNVKKQIQRHSDDEQIVVTTYEGTHTHPVDKSVETFDQILGNLLIDNLLNNAPPTIE
ncbi:probable WRKY transcription factor 75 isoform X2 [Vigna unguiculata]|uniref:probable WRKY transcription factor 75 isoform X2 n=1 Tax=Vigna unguiculata TaxID=3917 RepID=UPI001015E30F|nr:probable WRKY transcription factor 75 isoform X2 [Vigna unguiculata]